MRISDRRCLVALVGVLTIGCVASTGMTSLPAPDIAGRSFKSILVLAEIEDLSLKFRMEDRVAQGFVRRETGERIPGVRFVPAYTILFPGRVYSEDEVRALLRQNEIDAILVITPGASGSEDYYHPPTYTTRCASYSSTSGCTEVATTPTGGFAYSKPWQQFKARLVDAANGQVDWVATATSGGNAFAHSTDLVTSMADKTLQRLYTDRVIRPDCGKGSVASTDSGRSGSARESVQALQDSVALGVRRMASMQARFAVVSDSMERIRRASPSDPLTLARLTQESADLTSAATAEGDQLRRRSEALHRNQILASQQSAYCR